MDFLKIAVEHLATYKTPQSLIDYININILIQKPPYKNKFHRIRI